MQRNRWTRTATTARPSVGFPINKTIAATQLFETLLRQIVTSISLLSARGNTYQQTQDDFVVRISPILTDTDDLGELESWTPF